MPEPEDLIPVGRIIGSHGVRGLARFHSWSGNPDSISVGSFLTIRMTGGTLREYKVRSLTPHSGKFLLGLDGLNDISQVQEIAGSEVCLKRCQLPETEEDEYYWCDLIGIRVITDDGRDIGSITDIFETGSNDVYVVKGDDGRERLIPAIADVVSKIDTRAGTMIITPLEGLLEL